ncbi:MAG: YggT family protein [Deltaproteobacteria bacterium]|nr:YggT family protein [Deltaproteobacteria bacterium]
MSPNLALLIYRFLEFFTYVIIARVLITWVIRDPENPINKVLGTLVDPMTRPFKRYLTWGMMDFSPIVLILAVNFLQSLLVPYFQAH